MGTKKSVFLSILVIIILVAVFYLITNTITRVTGYTITGKSIYTDDKLDSFSRCLTNKGFKLYVFLDDCPECEKQMEYFKESLFNINLINCQEEYEKCKNLEGVPAWETDKEIIYGRQRIHSLSKLSGCEI